MEDKIKDLSFDMLFNKHGDEIKEKLSKIENPSFTDVIEVEAEVRLSLDENELKDKDFNKEVKSEEVLEEERLTINISKEVIIPNIRAKERIIKQIQLWFDTGEDIVIADKIFHLAASGLLRKDIKKTLKINMNLWNEMIKDPNSIYYDAILRGEVLGIGEMVDSVKNLGLGYDYVEVKKGTRNGKAFHEVHKRHKPAEFNAAKYYLENKLGSEWGSKLNINLNSNNEGILTQEEMQNMPKELLFTILQFIQDERDKTRNVVSVQ